MAALPRVTSLDGLRLRLGELNRGPVQFEVDLDQAARTQAAKELELVDLMTYSAKATVKPWLDGAELEGAWTAEVVQTCGLSLETFSSPLAGTFTLRLLPAASPNAPADEGEMEFDLDAADPPDVLADDVIAVGAYLLEHLGLAVDPFPRKPGAVFEPPVEAAILSPFAALKALKPD